MLRLSTLISLAVLTACSGKTAEENKTIIAIQPLGHRAIPKAEIAIVQQALTAFYAVETRLLKQVPLPEEHKAALKGGDRYSASGLLQYLRGKRPKDAEKILGITAADIYDPKENAPYWRVMGLASVGQEPAIITTGRTKRNTRNAQHGRERLAKVAVHELGHAWGLYHCGKTTGCLLESAKGKGSTTDHAYDLCPHCRQILKQKGYNFPTDPKPPWPKPR